MCLQCRPDRLANCDEKKSPLQRVGESVLGLIRSVKPPDHARVTIRRSPYSNRTLLTGACGSCYLPGGTSIITGLADIPNALGTGTFVLILLTFVEPFAPLTV